MRAMLANAINLAADHALSDALIVSHILAGKKEEYEILVRRYNSMLYKTARGILRDEKDIEDAMQEAYTRGYEKIHQFRNEAKFSTWLTRILINCALKQLNKKKGNDFVDIDSLGKEDNGRFLELPGDPPENDLKVNLESAIESAIDQLPPKYRLVFILREIEHTPVADVAGILSISEENVKVRLHRAKGMLREILKSQLSSLDIFEFHAVRCSLMAERVMAAIDAI